VRLGVVGAMTCYAAALHLLFARLLNGAAVRRAYS
jgi:hypothetical protein